MRRKNHPELGRPIRVILIQNDPQDPRQIRRALHSARDLELVAVVDDAVDDWRSTIETIAQRDAHVLVLDCSCALTATNFIRNVCADRSEIRTVVLLPSNEHAFALPILMAGASACIANSSGCEQVLHAVRSASFGYTMMGADTAEQILAKLHQMVSGTEQTQFFDEPESEDGGAANGDAFGSSSTDARARAVAPDGDPGRYDKAHAKGIEHVPRTRTRKEATSKDSATSVKTPEMNRISSTSLSPREHEVLSLIVKGLSNQQIADHLFVSLPTAKAHVRNILTKLGVSDRTQAAVTAMRMGLV